MRICFRKYLEGVEEELAVHADLPARPLERRHPNKDDVVDAKHQDQYEGGLCQFSIEREKKDGEKADGLT